MRGIGGGGDIVLLEQRFNGAVLALDFLQVFPRAVRLPVSVLGRL
jgi:hypothetical protein